MRIDSTINEQALLGACFLNTKAPLIASEYVGSQDFYYPKNALIFGAMLDIISRSGGVDGATVCAELGSRLDAAGGAAYVFSLSSLCPVATRVSDYARAVRTASLDRQVRTIVQQAVESCEGETLLTELQERLYQLEAHGEKGSNMDEVWEQFQDELTQPLVPGCEYPWQKIQWLTRGLRPGWLCILAGEASAGKTAASLAVCKKALEDGKRVLLISQEMSKRELAIRFAQQEGFESGHYYENRITPQDQEKIYNVAQKPYWKNLRLERIEKVAQLPLHLRRWRPELLIVDHLQLLEGAEEVKMLSVNTRRLKTMAEDFTVPILCLSQLSRAREDREAKPTLSRLRGSGTIEQDADTVVFIWRKRDENTETWTDEAALIVAKTRMGRPGTVRARFDGANQAIRVIDSVHTLTY